MADEAVLTLPKLTKGTNNGLTGGVGWNVTDPNGFTFAAPELPSLTATGAGLMGGQATCSLTLAPLVMYSAGDTGVRLPSLQVTATGLTGRAAAADLLFPQLVVSATGFTGRNGSAVLALPSLRVDARGIDSAELLLPALKVTASSLTGAVGRVGAATLPALGASATGITVNLGSAALALPAFRVAATGVSATTARLSATLPALALAAAGVSGKVGTAQLVLPIVRLTATGHGPAVGVAVLELPALTLRATGFGAASALAGDYGTLNLNTLNEALTRYTGWKFNSMTHFEGLYLAANADGIFKLEGATDAGALIEAAARLGVTDFGDPNVKKIDQAYFGYRAESDLLLRIITDEHDIHEYRLESTGHEGAHNVRVKLGKGMRGRYYQIELANENGGDFRLDQGELRAIALKRRIA